MAVVSRVTVSVSGPVTVFVVVTGGDDGEVLSSAAVGNCVFAPAGAGVWPYATDVDVVVLPPSVAANSDGVMGPGDSSSGDSSGVVMRGMLCKRVKEQVAREAVSAVPFT